jgi:hypothetical protein
MADFKEKAVAEVEKIFKIIDERIAEQSNISTPTPPSPPRSPSTPPNINIVCVCYFIEQIADVVAKTGQRPA